MTKDTIHNTYVCIGASNHSKLERDKFDLYATSPIAAYKLLSNETFSKNIWEPACGLKHLSNVFEEKGHNVRSSDIINRCDNEVYDFLSIDNMQWDGDIITNPPYKLAYEFIEKAINIIPDGHKVAMFLKLLFLEGKKRKAFFKINPPKRVLVFSERVICAKDGDFKSYNSSAIAYAWFIWIKGYKGETTVSWI